MGTYMDSLMADKRTDPRTLKAQADARKWVAEGRGMKPGGFAAAVSARSEEARRRIADANRPVSTSSQSLESRVARAKAHYDSATTVSTPKETSRKRVRQVSKRMKQKSANRGAGIRT